MRDPASTWLTVKEVASQCGVHPNTVRSWMNSGELDYIKLGSSPRSHVRITPEAVRDLASRRKIQAHANRTRRGRPPKEAA